MFNSTNIMLLIVLENKADVYERDAYVGAICILDILGTKGVWKRDATGYIRKVNLLYRDFTKLVDIVNGMLAGGLKKSGIDEKSFIADFRTFSDTIIISSLSKQRLLHSSSHGGVTQILEIHLILLGVILIGFIQAAIQQKIYFRGSLGLGKIYKKNDIVIGPAIDEAACDYEQSNWIGISLTPNASLFVNREDVSKFSEVLKSFFIPHDLSKKTGIDKSCYVLAWPRFFFGGINPDSVQIIEESLKFELDNYIDYRIFTKFKNTIEFCKVLKHGRRELGEFVRSRFSDL